MKQLFNFWFRFFGDVAAKWKNSNEAQNKRQDLFSSISLMKTRQWTCTRLHIILNNVTSSTILDETKIESLKMCFCTFRNNCLDVLRKAMPRQC